MTRRSPSRASTGYIAIQANTLLRKFSAIPTTIVAESFLSNSRSS